MIVLGISDHFVSGAALVVDGRVVAAINEERLVRMKMVMGFPWKSIAAVLELAGVRAQDVDVVAVASKWGHFLKDYIDTSKGVLALDEGAVKNTFFNVGSKLSALRSSLPFLEPLYYQLRQPSYWKRRKAIEAALRSEYGLKCPVRYTWHHQAHAACAYYASGFDDALVVTLDGSGDGHSSHVYEVNGGKWKFLHAVPSFDGIGNFYGYVTHIAGFKAGRHEGKITGLAAHGKPTYERAFEELIRYENGSMRNVGNAFRHRAVSLLRKRLPEGYSREDLAASIQSLTEKIAVDYVGYWVRKTGKTRVALAGGVMANVKVNQRIHEIPEVEELFIYPAMSDEGLSAGSALLEAAKTEPSLQSGGIKCFDNVYLGPGFSEKQIATALQAKNLPLAEMKESHREVAKLIADGYVVARFDGRMEYGPRALGNRTIMYRPDDPTANDWLNERLDRTEFMPFAPVTLVEDADACYVNLDGARDAARFMTITFDCTPEMAKSCPGVVHVDGTARPQLIAERDNPPYYQIVKTFKEITGIPSVVNTSFNIHEEPIVCTPDDAIRAFEKGHLDVLAIGNFLVKNRDADSRVGADRVAAGKASSG